MKIKKLICKKMKLKCVMFDLCGTLMDNELALKRVDSEFNFPLWKKRGYKGTLKEFKKVKEEVNLYLEGVKRQEKLSKFLFERLLSKKLKIPLSEEQIRDDFYKFYKYYIKKVKLFDSAKEILTYIKRKGLLLILISNGWQDINMKIMEKLCIKKYFDYIIISDIFGSKKSELLPFKHVLTKFGLKSEECLMVGDKLDEDAYCRKLGIKFVLFENGKENKYFKETEGTDFKIKRLTELKNIINNF